MWGHLAYLARQVRLPTNHLFEISHKNVTVDKFRWYSMILKKKQQLETTYNKVKYVDIWCFYDKTLARPSLCSLSVTASLEFHPSAKHSLKMHMCTGHFLLRITCTFTSRSTIRRNSCYTLYRVLRQCNICDIIRGGIVRPPKRNPSPHS